MLSEVLQSTWFWPLTLILLAGYYGWVLFNYFGGSVRMALFRIGSLNPGAREIITMRWDDVVLSYQLHRRLIENPLAQLNPKERSLLGKSPFRELLQRDIKK